MTRTVETKDASELIDGFPKGRAQEELRLARRRGFGGQHQDPTPGHASRGIVGGPLTRTPAGEAHAAFSTRHVTAAGRRSTPLQIDTAAFCP